MGRLEGKIALITGANSGIGEAAARLFAREGATIVIVDLKKDNFNAVADSINNAGGRAIAIPGDVSSLADCQNALKTTIDTFGKIDILVNNAGISDFTIPAVRLTDEGWQKSISINQTGTFYYCREALKYMEKAGSGSIINVSSVGGVYAIAGLAYSATKAAVLAITKNIAIQYAGTNIRCNAVCPGATNTGMMNPDVEKLFDKEMWDIVQKRADPDIAPVEPIDQANAMLFFASDESRYVTGQTIVVDHGKFL